MKTQRDCLQPKAHSLQPGFHYHPSGWRVSKVTATSDTLYLYGPGGQLLSACAVVNGVRGTCSAPVYFAGRLLYDAQGNRVLTDRLGTVRAVNGVARNYYPFGEIGTPSANNTYKFASTYRDSTTGLDYAINRYYASGTARFITPDPLGHGAAKLTNSISWNMYLYSRNDPVNGTDASGLDVDLVDLYIGNGSTTGFNGTYCVNGQASLEVHTAWTGSGAFTIHIEDVNGGTTSDSRYWVTAEGGIRVLDETTTLPGAPLVTQTYTTRQWSQSDGTVVTGGTGALGYQPYLSRYMSSNYQGTVSWGSWSAGGEGGGAALAVSAGIVGNTTTITQDYWANDGSGNTLATAHIEQVFTGGTLTSFTERLWDATRGASNTRYERCGDLKPPGS